MPDESFEQRRRRWAAAQQRRGAMMAETVARLAEMQRRALERLEEQHERLAERMRRHGVGIDPTWPRRRKRRPKDDRESGGVPAIPDRPKNLSGGAAAELEHEAE